MNKEEWLDFAEVVDALRVFPRILVAGYMLIVGAEVAYLTVWYAHLPSVERTVEVTAFYSLIMGGLFGLAAYVFKVYSDGGYNWDSRRGHDVGDIKTTST